MARTTRCLAFTVAVLLTSQAVAQDVVVTTPTLHLGDGFHENLGVFPFGGFNPNADATLGIGFRGGGGNFNLTFFAGQESRRSLTTQASQITIPNGGSGAIIDVLQRPFVVGYVPVVGGWPVGNAFVPPPTVTYTSPLTERIAQLRQSTSTPVPSNNTTARANDRERKQQAARTSTADRGDISVAEIRRQRSAIDEPRRAEKKALADAAQKAESEGQLSTALEHYDSIRRISHGRERRQMEAKIRTLRSRLKQETSSSDP